MTYVYLPEIIESSKKNKTFYVVRIGLQDNTTKQIIARGSIVMWLDEDTYKKLLNI